MEQEEVLLFSESNTHSRLIYLQQSSFGGDMSVFFFNRNSYLRTWWHWVRTWRALPVKSWIKAEMLFEKGRFAEAVEQYRSGLSTATRHPARIAAAAKLAHCLCKTGRFKDAVLTLEEAIREDPSRRDTYVRLAKLDLWLCRPRDAVSTIKECLSRARPDAEIAGLYLLAALECGESSRGVIEAYGLARHFNTSRNSSPFLRTALARYDLIKGNRQRAKSALARLCSEQYAPIEAFIVMGELFLREGNTEYARKYLRKALSVSPQHPRIQTLLAESYLTEGPTRAPEYALQLASNACRVSQWENPHTMHVLAEAFYQCGKRTDALLVAHKAREVGSRYRLSGFREADNDSVM